MSQIIKNLWHFGSLDHPSDSPIPIISDQRWRWIVRAWSGSLRDQAYLHKHPWSKAHWIRNLYLVEARWRLVKYLIMGALLGLLLAACGPALREQVNLRRLSGLAVSSCKANNKTCAQALKCSESSKAAAQAIQDAQIARSKNSADPSLEILATGLYSAALSNCSAGGWR